MSRSGQQHRLPEFALSLSSSGEMPPGLPHCRSALPNFIRIHTRNVFAGRQIFSAITVPVRPSSKAAQLFVPFQEKDSRQSPEKGKPSPGFFFLFSPLFFPMLSYVSQSFRDRFNVKAHEVDGDLRRQCRLRPDMPHPEAEAEHYGPGLPPFSVSSDTSQAAFSRSSVCNRQTHDGPTLCISCQEPGSPVPGRLLLPVSCPQKPA